MRGIVKACRRPRWFARATGGGFPRPSGGVPRGSRCPASPRHALLAENLGKPSLWVIINETWYQMSSGVAPKPSSIFFSITGASASSGPRLSARRHWKRASWCRPTRQ